MTVHSGWAKIFNDGSVECGRDKDVAAHKSSWSRGRLDGIVSVVLLNTPKASYTLNAGEGEYTQVDCLSATFSGINNTVPAEFINRRIAKKLNGDDVGKRLRMDQRTDDDDGMIYTFELSKDVDGALIRQQVEDRWLVVEVDMETGKPLCQIRDTV